MHLCEFLFLKNEVLIIKAKDDINTAAGAMIAMGYVSLVLSLIGEIFVEAFRVELILIALFNSIAIVLGFIQFAKIDCATKRFPILKEMVETKPLAHQSYGLYFAGAVALGTCIAIYFANSFSDIPLIVIFGALLHLAATIIVSNYAACSIIRRYVKR